MSQEELAERAEMTLGGILALELGQGTPTTRCIVKVSVALSVSPRELCEGVDSRDPGFAKAAKHSEMVFSLYRLVIAGSDR